MKLDKNRVCEISVILLTYNQVHTIQKAIDSVLSQQLDVEYELLIGDDCSTDGTAELLLEQKVTNASVILRNENIGASANLLDLIKRCSGRYIAYLEGDDYWIDKEKLQKQYDYLVRNPKHIGCTHNVQLVDSSGNVLQNKKIFWINPKNNFSLNDFKGYYLPSQISSLMHCNVFRGVGDRYDSFFKIDKNVSDRALFCILMHYGTIHNMNTIMGCYRIDSCNSTTSKLAKSYNRVLFELHYTLSLEICIKSIFHKKSTRYLIHYKTTLLLFAVCEYLYKPSSNSKSTIKQVLQSDLPALLIVLLPAE